MMAHLRQRARRTSTSVSAQLHSPHALRSMTRSLASAVERFAADEMLLSAVFAGDVERVRTEAVAPQCVSTSM